MKLKGHLLFLFLVFLIVGMILLAGCPSGVVNTPVEEEIEIPAEDEIEVPVTAIENVTALEAYNLINENRDNPDFVVLDVRTTDEYNDGHLEGADNIDFYAPDFSEQISRLDKEKTFLIYCRSGNRSGQALSIMEEMNFRMIYHMNGGMLEWNAEELPTVK